MELNPSHTLASRIVALCAHSRPRCSWTVHVQVHSFRTCQRPLHSQRSVLSRVSRLTTKLPIIEAASTKADTRLCGRNGRRKSRNAGAIARSTDRLGDRRERWRRHAQAPSRKTRPGGNDNTFRYRNDETRRNEVGCTSCDSISRDVSASGASSSRPVTCTSQRRSPAQSGSPGETNHSTRRPLVMDGTSFGMGISTCSGSLLAIEKCFAGQIGLVHGCGPRERSPLLLHDERLGATSDRAGEGIDFTRKFHMGEVRCATRRIHGAAEALLRPAETRTTTDNLSEGKS